MDKKAKKKELEDRFKELSANISELKRQVQQMEAERYQLQGQYQLLMEIEGDSENKKLKND